MKKLLSVLIACFLINSLSAKEKNIAGTLSDNTVISSTILGYDLQYRVYTPENYEQLSDLPVIYLTDGQWYLEAGSMHEIMDEMISNGEIEPLVAVFVDNRDPHNLKNNRRNKQFLGYDNYIDFYREELVPHIEENFKVSKQQKDRGIMGLSFGGLNATYFGAKASDTFHMLGIQSPALHPVSEIYDLYLKQDRLPLKIFLTTGTKNDTEVHARRLKSTLETKRYDFKYMEVDEGHNWRNWKPLLDDALLYFFKAK
ncbi:alpha/beta hydrolase [Roseivirga sp.]|uniref:alpha/beta hydrolase n=1 Tax=Roseivirga sp. TaxID=1964215 RepID=UPI003B8CD4C6